MSLWMRLLFALLLAGNALLASPNGPAADVPTVEAHDVGVASEGRIVQIKPDTGTAWWYRVQVFSDGSEVKTPQFEAFKRCANFNTGNAYQTGELVKLGEGDIAYPRGGGALSGPMLYRATRDGTVTTDIQCGSLFNFSNWDVDWRQWREQADVLPTPVDNTCQQVCNPQPCNDGLDNDGDGRIDRSDGDCYTGEIYYPTNTEHSACPSACPPQPTCGQPGYQACPPVTTTPGYTDPNQPLTPETVRSWCVSGDCSSWRFVQLKESNGFLNPHAVKFLTGSFATFNVPSGAYVQHAGGTTNGAFNGLSVREASFRHTGH